MAIVTSTTRVATDLLIGGEQVTYQSAITMIGIQQITSFLAAPFSRKRAFMLFVGIGQGELAPSTEDVSLEREVRRNPGTPSESDGVYGVYANFPVGQITSSYILREIALYDQLVGGNMFVRFLLDVDITIVPASELEIAVSLYFERG